MYTEFFGFSQAPFGMTPDPSFLYLSKKHEEALGHLEYGIRERKGFVAITGEIGAGKTTLCRSLLNRLPKDHVISMVLNPAMTPSELLKSIVEDFGIDAGRKTGKELLDELNRFLLSVYTGGGNAVILIDECQDLDVESLEQVRLISNLETEKTKLVQIVLIGQPELKEKLLQPELRQLEQRITVRYHIEPLDEKEARSYILYRLEKAGTHHKVEFQQATFDKIHEYSLGVPRLINSLCDRALLAGFVDSSYRITPTHVDIAAREVLWRTDPARVALQEGRTRRGWGRGAAVLMAVCLLAFWASRAQWTQEVRPSDVSKTAQPRVSIPVAGPGEPFRILAGLWGVTVTPEQMPQGGDPASFEAAAQAIGLRSELVRTTGAVLKSVDVPVLVEVYDPSLSNAAWHVFLGQASQEVHLLAGAQEVIMAEEDFSRRWLGTAFVLLQDLGRILEDPEAASTLLAQAGWKETDLATTLRIFQDSKGLTETGTMDAMTALCLYGETDPTRIPRLLWTEAGE